jgi:DNA-binding NarL/FixJ family response regulator
MTPDRQLTAATTAATTAGPTARVTALPTVTALAAVTTAVTTALTAVDIVLVDDHAILRQGLRSILEREPDLAVVGEASTAAEAMAVVQRCRPAIVLLDLKLSTGADAEGLELCSRLTERHPGLGVLVLTTFLDDPLVVEAIHRGARGYVVKDVDTTELLRAIRAVARGESAFDSRSAAAMVRSMREHPDEPTFTDRERNVLELLARGLSNRDIGRRLYISETTVKFHVRNIMRKLDAATRAEAVYGASKMGVI